MNSPTDDDSEFDPEELFYRAETALVDARAKVAGCEYELARLAKEYPAIAALRPAVSEYTVSDLRTDKLNEVLDRINPALGLTGQEQDYWLRLWEFAREKRWVDEDEFDGVMREELAAIIDAGLLRVHTAEEQAQSTEPTGDTHSSTANNGAIDAPALPNQQRNTWARSRNPHTENLHANVRRMKSEGLSQLEMCEHLDAQKLRPPDLVSWRHLTWRAAYLSREYNGAVKKWISKVPAVTP